MDPHHAAALRYLDELIEACYERGHSARKIGCVAALDPRFVYDISKPNGGSPARVPRMATATRAIIALEGFLGYESAEMNPERGTAP